MAWCWSQWLLPPMWCATACISNSGTMMHILLPSLAALFQTFIPKKKEIQWVLIGSSFRDSLLQIKGSDGIHVVVCAAVALLKPLTENQLCSVYEALFLHIQLQSRPHNRAGFQQLVQLFQYLVASTNVARGDSILRGGHLEDEHWRTLASWSTVCSVPGWKQQCCSSSSVCPDEYKVFLLPLPSW